MDLHPGGPVAFGSARILPLVALSEKLKEAGVPEGPPVPPAQWAWDAIQVLEDSDLIEAGHVKEFYIRLSEILRGYLERQYGMSALERTSSELLSDFRKMNLTHNVTSLLRDFLETGDLVKFAKYTPNEEDVEKDLNRVKEIVTATTPQNEKDPKEMKQPANHNSNSSGSEHSAGGEIPV